jgi:hypothetical protein
MIKREKMPGYAKNYDGICKECEENRTYIHKNRQFVLMDDGNFYKKDCGNCPFGGISAVVEYIDMESLGLCLEKEYICSYDN